MDKSPLKPFGRSLSDFGQLKLAEQKLLDACRKGDIAGISDKRPEQATAKNMVRADFVRFLALGGDEYAPVHEKGALLSGAWIDGDLNLENANLPHSLGLIHCHLNNVTLRHSKINGSVCFSDSSVLSLKADAINCGGSIFLDNGFTSTDRVRLVDSQITGNLQCSGAKFDSKKGDDNKLIALACDGAVVGNCVFLNDGFIATGVVRLVGAQIGNSLECDNASFDEVATDNGALICTSAVIKGNVFLSNGFKAIGEINFQGAKIGGKFECMAATFNNLNKTALRLDGTHIAGAFHFKDLLSISGNISLVSAKVDSLIDDISSYPNELEMDGFIYDRLIYAPTDAKARLAWLDKQPKKYSGLDKIGKEFKSQPWQQLQKVLHEMGHHEDARQVAIAFEDRLREANLIGQTPEDWCKPVAKTYRKISCGSHWLFGALIGYGYRPLRLFFYMIAVWLIFGVIYWGAAVYGNNGNGVFAPSNPLVFQNKEYAACVPDSCAAKVEKTKACSALHNISQSISPIIFQNAEYKDCMSDIDVAKAILAKKAVQGAGNWYLCEDLRAEYTGFSPFTYSLDLILPLVDLQQENDWSPMIPPPTNTSAFWTWSPSHEYFIRFLVWFEILFGWMASLLLVAVVSGLTKRREE